MSGIGILMLLLAVPAPARAHWLANTSIFGTGQAVLALTPGQHRDIRLTISTTDPITARIQFDVLVPVRSYAHLPNGKWGWSAPEMAWWDLYLPWRESLDLHLTRELVWYQHQEVWSSEPTDLPAKATKLRISIESVVTRGLGRVDISMWRVDRTRDRFRGDNVAPRVR